MSVERKTDLIVAKMLGEAGIKYSPEKSGVKDIDEALKTASKKGTGNSGFPEYIAFSKDFIILIEDKYSNEKHILEDETGIVMTQRAITEYAVNGALHYGIHVGNHTRYKKIFSIGVSGDETHLQITPTFIDANNQTYHLLNDLKSFEEFSEDNIEEYYRVAVLKELPKVERELQEIKVIAAELHEDLRNFGSLEGEKKATVVSAILLALENSAFELDDLKSDNPNIKEVDYLKSGNMDGDKIFNAVKVFLQDEQISPYAKSGELLDQFNFIRGDITLNKKSDYLNMSPLKYFTIKLKDNLKDRVKVADMDVLGNFYGEFVKYGGNDGNALGIVLTPRHITSLMAELVNITKDDYVLDPCCGTGGFLITAMQRMFKQAKNDTEMVDIKINHIHGIELQQKLFTIATTNMILRNDGKSNLIRANMFDIDYSFMEEKKINKVLINPPYSQAKNKDLYYLSELNFVRHSLELMEKEGTLCAIIPTGALTNKNNNKAVKKILLENHTLDAVITLNKETFYGTGTHPCIIIMQAKVPHAEEKRVKFINFEDDGYYVRKHIGLVGDGSENDKETHLLGVMRDYIDDDSKFIIKSKVSYNDEWLHSFFYFNDELPLQEDFEAVIADYLTFETDRILKNRGHLFNNETGVANENS